uniref:Pyroglutamyl-peptidase I like n=1 Tax=Macaca mulatta TaxID=9544 RepID=A0A5F7ZMR7_MACMU
TTCRVAHSAQDGTPLSTFYPSQTPLHPRQTGTAGGQTLSSPLNHPEQQTDPRPNVQKVPAGAPTRCPELDRSALKGHRLNTLPQILGLSGLRTLRKPGGQEGLGSRSIAAPLPRPARGQAEETPELREHRARPLGSRLTQEAQSELPLRLHGFPAQLRGGDWFWALPAALGEFQLGSSEGKNPAAQDPGAQRPELSKLGLGNDTVVQLRTLELPVDYREAKQRVTGIWEDHQPQLVVHVGMDTCAKAIILEQSGKNQGYQDTDIRGFRPEGGVCLPGGPDMLESGVCMKAVCKHVAVEDVEVLFSRDAGRYVCDYTYYLSLHHGKGCAALIHVPPLSRGLPASLLGRALQVIIQEMLEECGKA